MSATEFEGLVSDALDTVPEELAAMIDNCVIVVEDDPPPDEPDLLGVYDGTPLTERDTVDDVVEEVHITVVHEIAHHFGIDDDRLHDLGYA